MQTASSAKTSLKQVAAGINKLIKRNVFNRGDIVVDVGGGKYDLAADHAATVGATLVVYDPFNRTTEHNDTVRARYLGKADHVTMNNVANVIDSDDAVVVALETAREFLSDDGMFHFTVYVGDSSGIGKSTMNGESYQRNWKLKAYLPLIERVFPPAVYMYHIEDSVLTLVNDG